MKTRGRCKKPKVKLEPEIVTVNEADYETTCSVCLAEFLDSEDLRVHISQVHPFTKSSGYVCNFCLTATPSVEDFVIHIRDEHLSYIKFCKYCSRSFLDSEELKNHEESHETGKKDRLSCSHCRILFRSPKALQDHESSAHLDSRNGVMLSKYSPHFSSVINMKVFDFISSLNETKKFICFKCKHETVDLAEHIKHVRKGECQVYVCDSCSTMRSVKHYLHRHFVVHPECLHNHKLKDVLIKCPCCKQDFTYSSMKLHVKKCNVIKCKACNIVFKSIQDLTAHQSASHPMSMLLKQCRYCNQEIVGAEAFKKHMNRLHKKDYHLYKYKCIQCQLIFQHPKRLFGHYFSSHRDLKPYTCKICNLGFRIRKTFTIHIKMKHESKGYVEFDENFHVFFVQDKPENSFQPPNNPSLFTEKELQDMPLSETEYETDNKDTVNKKKTKKIKINLDTDVALETDISEGEVKKKKRVVHKRKLQKTNDVFSSDDDQPLLKLKIKHIPKYKYTNIKDVQRRLHCVICKKYCYTVQNYNRHFSLHFKSESKQCIKCAKLFTTKEELDDHMKTDHATQKITETLKRLLEKRKTGLNKTGEQVMPANKFAQTIHKVYIPPSSVKANIKLSNGKNLSVRNFIENFTPEDTKRSLESSALLKAVLPEKTRASRIKMTRCCLEEAPKTEIKLQMPVKFNSVYNSHCVATLKFADEYQLAKPRLIFEGSKESNVEYYDDIEMDDDDPSGDLIPEVAEEVMLDGDEKSEIKEMVQINETETENKEIVREIILPATKHKIQIAHLQPQAPFFKIVPVDQLMDPKKEIKEEDDVKDIEFELPSGTKLVHSNPLSHLLDEKAVEQVLSVRKKRYYKPKNNLKDALAKALLQLQESPTPPATKKRKKSQVTVE